MGATRLRLETMRSPLGPFTFVADSERRLLACGWSTVGERMTDLVARLQETHGAFVRGRDPGGPRRGLTAYFDGELSAIDTLEVVFTGTAFQQAVWGALRDIPCGTTRSYGELARSLGRAEAMRAVGHANGANPLGVVVPCHRLVGKDGALTGYGGGLPRKQWLLAHEGAAVGGR